MRTNTTRRNRFAPRRAGAMTLALAAGCALSLAHAAEAADLPMTRITLYRSGVGYFEHRGTVSGDDSATLRFDTEKINDILKSMTLMDLDGGRIGSVSYDSKAPLERRLGSFGVNIGDNPSIATLLGRLRGSDIKVSTAEGPLNGTILGVETRGAPAKPYLNLLTGTGVRSVSIEEMRTFELADAALAGDLRDALLTLAQARSERSGSVDVSFFGRGDRRVVVGYVHEAPVWKTSYRIVLPAETGGDIAVQAWAIVENTTDQDWNDVRLSLVAGNPVSFTMDLHTPLFLRRPSLPVPVMALLRSRAYEDDAAKMIPTPAAQAPSAPSARYRSADAMGQVLMERGEAGARDDVGFDGGSGVGSMATGTDAGEQFRYDLSDTVTIERQKSAMLPIMVTKIEGERISIYNPGDQREHPMRGVEIRNTTGSELAPGPISVYDAGSYAGDAQIGFTSRDQSRLLSYAIDLDVRVLKDESQGQRVTSLKIVDGVIEQTIKHTRTTTYTLINRDRSRGRTVLVEQPKLHTWEVASPEVRSESETLRRFEVKLDAGQQQSLDVIEERVELQRVAVTSLGLDTLMSYATTGQASQQVVDAVRRAGQMQGRINELQRQIAALDQENRSIGEDQNRMRSNISSGRIAQNTEIYARYMQKLMEQEQRIEQIHEQRSALFEQSEAARKALNDYLSNLNVE